MEELVFEVVKPRKAESTSQIMRVDSEFYNLCCTLQVNTGLQITKITARIAEYLDGKIKITETD